MDTGGEETLGKMVNEKTQLLTRNDVYTSRDDLLDLDSSQSGSRKTDLGSEGDLPTTSRLLDVDKYMKNYVRLEASHVALNVESQRKHPRRGPQSPSHGSTPAHLVNFSIDDTYGDSRTGQIPLYQPIGDSWYYPSSRVSADSSVMAPSPSFAFDKTWTGTASADTNITISFTGISIWVFFILLNVWEAVEPLLPVNSTDTACNFTLDGNYMGSFFHAAGGVGIIQYDAPVFNATGLDNSQHELVILTKYGNSCAIFDYAIYTYDHSIIAPADVADNTTSSTLTGSSSTSAIDHVTSSPEIRDSSPISGLRVIIGCAVGGLGLVMLVVVLVLRFRRSRKKRNGVIEPTIATSCNPNDVTISNSTELPQQNYIYNENLGLSWGILPNQPGMIHSRSFDSTGRPGALVPFLQFQPSSHVPNEKGRDELRVARQMEINQHLQSAQQEIQNLSTRQESEMQHSEPSHGSSSSIDVRRRGTERGMEVMREQIRQLNTRIENLRMQLSSDWAQGLSDEPPPAYY
ncbi:hypothetical protein F5887DRAFT_922112 [Amanita rubescens]|nr:hypothetical protein F5887DRAFT_922112 [Amanita rubescens]